MSWSVSAGPLCPGRAPGLAIGLAADTAPEGDTRVVAAPPAGDATGNASELAAAIIAARLIVELLGLGLGLGLPLARPVACCGVDTAPPPCCPAPDGDAAAPDAALGGRGDEGDTEELLGDLRTSKPPRLPRMGLPPTSDGDSDSRAGTPALVSAAGCCWCCACEDKCACCKKPPLPLW